MARLEKDNSTSIELFPELRGLSGGKKQHWLNSHLDVLATLYEVLPFDQLCSATYCKPETLLKALKKQEGRHRPSLRVAEQALSVANLANSGQVANRQELKLQFELLSEAVNDLDDLKQNLSDFFEAQAHINKLMSNLVQKSRSNLTYHIGSTTRRKVRPTETKSITSSRPSVSKNSSGPAKVRRSTGPTQRHRNRTRKRWRGVR